MSLHRTYLIFLIKAYNTVRRRHTRVCTFMTASVCSSSHPTKACPDSWKATTLCSSLDRILLFFTLPEDINMHTICQLVPEWQLRQLFVFPQYSSCIIVPAITLSTAYSKLKVSMDLWPSLAACRAASLQILAMSAPAERKWVGNRGFMFTTWGWGVVMWCFFVEAGHYFGVATDVHPFTRG